MRRINTNAERQVPASIHDSAQFLEFRADRGALSRRIFEQELQIAELQSASGLAEPLRDGGNGLVYADGPRRSSPGWTHQIIGPQRHGAHQFLMKCLHRPGTQHRVGGREIDQIIVVNHQRTEPQFLAAGAKARGVRLRYARGAARPHARAGGENLQGVGAEAVREFKGCGDVACDRGVDADAPAAIFPGRNFRRGGRLRTILVGVVKEKVYSMLFVSHS